MTIFAAKKKTIRCELYQKVHSLNTIPKSPKLKLRSKNGTRKPRSRNGLVSLILKTFKTMAQIKSEAAYRAALKRIDELLPLVNDETPTDDKNYLELDMISDMVEEYEDVHYPIGKPSLIDVIKLRLYEMGINQTKLAEMLGLSTARVSEIMNGKSEPSLKIGRELSRKLNIDPAIVLGV